MDLHVQDFLALYQDAVDYVNSSGHRTYVDNLRNWFAIIEENPVARTLLQSLNQSVKINDWLQNSTEPGDGTVGSGNLNWPESRDETLAIRLCLFRLFSTGEIDPLEFGSQYYFDGSSKYDDVINSLNNQLFFQTYREFQRRVERAYRDIQLGEATMASDRIVKRSDNSKEFDDVVRTSTEVIEAFEKNNSYENFEEKKRLIAEIAAGRDLLKMSEMRIEAIRNTIWSALRFLVKKVADVSLTKVIGIAIVKLAALFGFAL